MPTIQKQKSMSANKRFPQADITAHRVYRDGDWLNIDIVPMHGMSVHLQMDLESAQMMRDEMSYIITAIMRDRDKKIT